jgi:pimeloyl-ACP methyl ester carboxylesterase
MLSSRFHTPQLTTVPHRAVVVLRASVCVAAVAVALLYVPALLIEKRFHASTHEFYSELSGRVGDLVQTPLGSMHYVKQGAPTAPLCLVMHGITVSAIYMQPLVDALVERGLQTIAFDFLGRGHSSSLGLDRAYTTDVYVQQVAGLLDALGLHEQPVHLVALSMGGAVAAEFAARYPTRVLSINLMAPAGVPFKMPWTAEVLRYEPLGRLLLSSPLGHFIMSSRFAKSFAQPERYLDDLDRLQQELQFHVEKPGFAHAISSTVANFNSLHDATPAYTQIGKVHKGCVSLFWGTNDTTVPLEPGARLLQQMIPHLSLHTFDGVGHSLIFERTAVIAENIAKCVKGTHAPSTVTNHK